MTEKRKTILKSILSLCVLAILLISAYLVLRALGFTSLSRDELRAYIEATGVIAPLVFIGISFLQVTIVPIPGAVTIIAGNYVFGPFWSFVYSYIGMMLGSMFAYFLGKKVGRPFINWLAGDAAKVDAMLAKLKGRENVLLFFMFLLPLFPDDLLCSIAGILPTHPLTFFIMQLVTRFISIAATLIFMSGEIRGWAYAVCIIFAAVAVPVCIWCCKNVEKVSDFFVRIGRKMTRRSSDEK